MQAMLATWKANSDLSQFNTENAPEDLISKLCLGSWGLQSIRSTGSTGTASAHPGMTSSALFGQEPPGKS